MRPLAWFHFQIELPDAWEVIAFRKNPEDGQLVISDRLGETLIAHWLRLKTKPAVERRLIELIANESAESTSEQEIRAGLESVGEWTVFVPKSNGVMHAACYEPENEVLLHFTFPKHPSDPRRDEARAVLASFQANAGDKRRFAAFGVDVRLPVEFVLSEIEALGAAQRIRFENRRGESVTLYRWGMLPVILADVDMATFFAQIKHRKCQLRREGTFRKDDRFDGVELGYTTRGTGGVSALLAKTWHGQVYLWSNDERQRLYAIEQHARPDHLLPQIYEDVVGT